MRTCQNHDTSSFSYITTDYFFYYYRLFFYHRFTFLLPQITLIKQIFFKQYF